MTSVISSVFSYINQIATSTIYQHDYFIKCLGDPNHRFPLNTELYMGSLRVRANDNIVHWPERLYVDGDLDMRDNKNLHSLPKSLVVEGDLDLRGCTNLESLPEDLRVKGNLILDGCTNLRSLPAKKPHVGGYLSFKGCINLTSVPSWITELGPTSSGHTREICLIGTVLSKNSIDSLKQAHVPGMRFYFSQESIYRQRLEKPLGFWLQETRNKTLSLPNIMFEPPELSRVIKFLDNLKEDTFEYRYRRGFLANRVMEAFKLMAENEEIKRKAVEIITQGLTSRSHHFYNDLDDIELMAKICQTKDSTMDEKELREMGTSYLMLETVNKMAKKYGEDELACQRILRHRFKLPIPSENMPTRGHAQRNQMVTSEEMRQNIQIEKIGNAIEKEYSEKMLKTFLSTWSPWIRHQQRDALKFWMQEAKNTTLSLPDIMFESHEQENVLTFCNRLKETAEYKNVQSRVVLANRVMEAFKLMAENKEIKSRAVDIITQGLTSSDDQIISVLDELELMVEIYHLEHSLVSETEVRKLGKSYLLLEMINQKAKEYQRAFPLVDEIEVCLAVQKELGYRFNLPASKQNRTFGGCAQITTEQIDKIGDAIEKEYSEEMLESFLSTWSLWIKYQELRYVYGNRVMHPSFHELSTLNSIPLTKTVDECYNSTFTEQLATYKGNYEALHKAGPLYTDQTTRKVNECYSSALKTYNGDYRDLFLHMTGPLIDPLAVPY